MRNVYERDCESETRTHSLLYTRRHIVTEYYIANTFTAVSVTHINYEYSVLSLLSHIPDTYQK